MMVNRSNNPDVSFQPLLLAALIGACIGGIFHPTWQHSVESGQVIAGVTDYPDHTNAFYIYHRYSFTIINYISAFLIKISSEFFASVALSAAQGLLSYLALALFVSSFLREKRFILAFFPLFFNSIGIAELDMPYPIELLGSVGYGSFSLSLLLISMGLYAHQRYQLLAWNLGFITPMVHPMIGALTFVIVLSHVVIFRNHIFGKDQLALRSFLKNLLFAVMLFGSVSFPLLKEAFPFAAFTEVSRAQTIDFISNWSTHHRDFPFLSLVGTVYLFLSFAIIFLFHKFQNRFRGQQLIVLQLTLIVVIGGLVAASLSHLPTEVLPMIFWQSMPLRVPNFAIICASVTFLALLLSGRYTLYLLLLIFAAIAFRFSFNTPFLVPILTLMIPLFTLVALQEKRCPAQSQADLSINRKIAIALVCFCVGWHAKNVSSLTSRGNMWAWRTEAVFFNRIGELIPPSSYLLTTGMELIQLKSGRPVFTTHAFNQALYLPSTWENILSSYKEIFNTDPTDLKKYRAGTLDVEIYRHTWIDRKAEAWDNLAVKYNIGGIVTYKTWHLNLPLLTISDQYAFYKLSPSNHGTEILFPAETKEFGISRAFSAAHDKNVFWESNAPTAIVLKYPKPTKIVEYSFRSGEAPERMPSGWTVEISKDGYTWRQIDKQQNIEFANENTKYFQIKEVEVTFLRITDFKVPDRQNFIRIYDIHFKGRCQKSEIEDLVFGACYPDTNSQEFLP